MIREFVPWNVIAQPITSKPGNTASISDAEQRGQYMQAFTCQLLRYSSPRVQRGSNLIKAQANREQGMEDPATVYLVDDDDDVREAVARLLRSTGFQTRAFASANDFVSARPFKGSGCVILDIRMPGMSGPELHATFASFNITLPVVFLSGNCDVPTSVQAMKRGAQDVLEKPVDADTLIEVVTRAIDLHRQQQQQGAELNDARGRFELLSSREHEVMQHVIAGRLNKQIAADLGIAEKTVKVHRGRVMSKMGIRSVAELVRMCQRLEEQ